MICYTTLCSTKAKKLKRSLFKSRKRRLKNIPNVLNDVILECLECFSTFFIYVKKNSSDMILIYSESLKSLDLESTIKNNIKSYFQKWNLFSILKRMFSVIKTFHFINFRFWKIAVYSILFTACQSHNKQKS